MKDDRPRPQEVRIAPLSPERLETVLPPRAYQEFIGGIALARKIFEGRVVWNVNSTGKGGGVAELLRSFLAYSRGAGINMRWLVISGSPEFFRITKRIHNFLHGMPGDGGELGDREAEVYRGVSAENANRLATVVRGDDVVLLHDPQTAGLVAPLKECGAKVVWRSHVGAEVPNERVRLAWDFVSPYIERADARIFSRRAYVPPWIKEGVLTEVIQPSIDVFSPKNQKMDEDVVQAILCHIGVVAGPERADVLPVYVRADSSPGRVDRRCHVVSEGPPRLGAPVVVQISRWDRLKDPLGVIRAFVEHVAPHDTEAHLMLGGPAVTGVADDPEGAEVFAEVELAWAALPLAARRRVHLVSFPMEDIDENAAMVNAVQRHATVVVQKSLEEGFGLTVAEAMWKSRPVIACAVGGIPDQIQDGVNGVLLEDPSDLTGFGERMLGLLRDAHKREELGKNAHERVRAHYLVNRHALQYIKLFAHLLRGGEVGAAAPHAVEETT